MRKGKFLSKWIHGFEGRYAVYYWPKTGHCEVWCFVPRGGSYGTPSKKPLSLQTPRQENKNNRKHSSLHYYYRFLTRIRYWNGKCTYKQIARSRLVYSHFVAPIPKGYDIHHIDGDQTNDDLNNLLCLSPRDHSKLHQQLKKAQNVSSS